MAKPAHGYTLSLPSVTPAESRRRRCPRLTMHCEPHRELSKKAACALLPLDRGLRQLCPSDSPVCRTETSATVSVSFRAVGHLRVREAYVGWASGIGRSLASFTCLQSH